MELAAWLRERESNARRIAATRTGKDRDGWLEDANYFHAAAAAIDGGNAAERERYRPAGHFRELPSAMSHRLWEQAESGPGADTVVLYELA